MYAANQSLFVLRVFWLGSYVISIGDEWALAKSKMKKLLPVKTLIKV